MTDKEQKSNDSKLSINMADAGGYSNIPKYSPSGAGRMPLVTDEAFKQDEEKKLKVFYTQLHPWLGSDPLTPLTKLSDAAVQRSVGTNTLAAAIIDKYAQSYGNMLSAYLHWEAEQTTTSTGYLAQTIGQHITATDLLTNVAVVLNVDDSRINIMLDLSGAIVEIYTSRLIRLDYKEKKHG